MIFEKSCGAVIYREENGKRLYLLEKMVKGHISLCKGHVEGRETEHETAIREIREETALTVEFVDGFRETISYSPYNGCMKEVVFFLAKALPGQTAVQPEEVQAIYWCTPEEAVGQLTYTSDRQVLEKAEEFMHTV